MRQTKKEKLKSLINKKWLSAYDITLMTGIPKGTVYSRCRSKYAGKRWGVVVKEFDGVFTYRISKENFAKFWKRKRIIPRRGISNYASDL